MFNGANHPSATNGWGFLDVYKYDGAGFSPAPPPNGVILHKFYAYDSGAQYVRTRVNGTWKSWNSWSASADKATSDSDGNNISSTYLKKGSAYTPQMNFYI